MGVRVRVGLGVGVRIGLGVGGVLNLYMSFDMTRSCTGDIPRVHDL